MLSLRGLLTSQIRFADVDFDVRQFRTSDPAARAHLEDCARAFMVGARVQARETGGVHGELERVPADIRGFAYEGAAMSAALLDLACASLPRHLPVLRAGPGMRYRHLIHVGVGWAAQKTHLRKLPLWWGLDPLLRWLALDGAGFQQMFFTSSDRRSSLLHPGTRPTEYIRVQGMGRALWFVHAGDVADIAAAIGAAPANVRPALWSGIGLAAAYAGASQPAGAALVDEAKQHFPQLSQGVVFAGAARYAHGIPCTHTEEAVRQILHVDLATCAQWADEAAAGLIHTRTDARDYLLWQTRLERRAVACLLPHAPNRAEGHPAHAQ